VHNHGRLFRVVDSILSAREIDAVKSDYISLLEGEVGMQIISVNLGQQRSQQIGTRLETTGIFKTPTGEPVNVTPPGLQADFIFNAKHHGGPDQAVYIYGATDYAWWSQELGREMAPGTFGENLTISDLESALFSIGDRLHFAEVILEVSAPRIPCSTLAARMGDTGFVKRYRQAERPGLYCRVIQPGFIQVGEQVRLEKYSGETLGVLEVFREYYSKHKSEDSLRRHLNAPVAIRVRESIQEEILAHSANSG
jgi:MOSC domain-containing protein YiiM